MSSLIIQTHSLSKKYDQKKVIRDLNIAIKEKEMIGITGKSGSGKSTLLNLFGLLETPSEGTLSLFGEKHIKLNSIKARNLLRYKIGYLFQNYALIDNDTVEKNLKIALKYRKNIDTKKEIQEALSLVGLDGFQKRKVFSLSGGEQQRVALARVYLKPFELLLADEPTGNLDHENRTIIMNILKQMNELGKTIIVVTHDEDVLDYFDRIINLD
ncbi:MAG: ATP-binding cassette domain-containing protein [Erysipelothrix sp.]|nr:ATP-binding cassette domain-containing protein [Erysipelothrix sp.]